MTDAKDMWATAEESAESVITTYRQAWAHADATIAELDLEAPGRVPWWRKNDVTLHHILVHVIAETARHVGLADIVREHIDGAAGLRVGATNLPDGDEQWWADYVGTLRQVAEDVGQRELPCAANSGRPGPSDSSTLAPCSKPSVRRRGLTANA